MVNLEEMICQQQFFLQSMFAFLFKKEEDIKKLNFTELLLLLVRSESNCQFIIKNGFLGAAINKIDVS